ncbi:MAG TPA: acyl dehydratase, partial [Candidatus Latescibacteria bacterium]|nr:acyl dehydratase [Candidatus Latescibacterota bacterium]
PLRLGDHAERRSTITSITTKEGRSGALCFVEVSHEITVAGTLCLTEIQSLVYREAAPADRRLPT